MPSDPDRRELLTFALFFVVNTPETWRGCSSGQACEPEAIERWKSSTATTSLCC